MVRSRIVIEAPELRLDAETLVESVDWGEIFGPSDEWKPDGPIEIEIGIGKGRFLLAAAEHRPHVRHLGVEWANKYLRFAEARAARRGSKNMRFVRMDAWQLMPAIPTSSVTAFYVFYPDPWPKKRHHKRRFLQRANADQIARALVPGGHLHVATDHDDYWSAIEPVFDGHDAFERQAVFGGPTFPVPADDPLTNFEIKYAVEGRNRHRATWTLLAP